MNVLPKALQEVIEALSALPGVGPRSAERYAVWLLKKDAGKALRLSQSLGELHEKIATCPTTFMFMNASDAESELYTHPSRDKSMVAVVAESYEVYALEKSAAYKGTYHVLGGLISPLDGIMPERLHIEPLLNRIKKDDVKEIILATNASVEGETTATYLRKILEGTGVKITRLARGLGVGVDLEYADQLTLARALEGRVNA
jgi:recombination protein RecR